jgi:anti-repressor protein
VGRLPETQPPPTSTDPIPQEAPVPQFPVITQAQIDGAQVNSVNARDLHASLGIGNDFSNWVKDQIRRARLVENRDFVTLVKKHERQILKEYFVTFDAAKQIGMMWVS